MEHKQIATTTERTSDLGEFSALAACYSVDRQNEIIRRGAFTETIGKWIASGRDLPVHWNHSGSAEDVIGSIDPGSMSETADGLYVEGKLDLNDSEVARQAWRSMKRNRVALSFGYMTLDQHKRADGVTELRSLDLFEISLTPAPANPDTRVLSMKGSASTDDEATRLVAILNRPRDEVDAKAGVPATKSTKPITVATFEC